MRQRANVMWQGGKQLTSLSRWDLTQNISSMHHMADRFANDPMFAGANLARRAPKTSDREPNVAIDVMERETTYIVSAAVPGARPEDLEIVLIDNVLTISGEFSGEKMSDDENYHLRERARGSFSRRIVFTSPVNAAQVETAYENGVLTLILPKWRNVTPTGVEVRPSLSRNVNVYHPRVTIHRSTPSRPST